MYIILPTKPDGLAKAIDNINSLTLDNLKNTQDYDMEVFIPKFKMSSTLKIDDILRKV